MYNQHPTSFDAQETIDAGAAATAETIILETILKIARTDTLRAHQCGCSSCTATKHSTDCWLDGWAS